MLQATLVDRKIERVVSREVPSIEGLCRTCSNAQGCTFPRDPSRPVWSCEEFNGGELDSSDPPTLEGRTVPEITGEATDLKGLCRECANRFTCCYPKPVGGVWHCEELA